MQILLLVIAVIGGSVGEADRLTPPAQFAPDSSEQGVPWIQNFDPDGYSSWRGEVKVGHAQNWSVAQGAQGKIYAANQEGLLSYDGERWTTIPVGASEATGRRSRRVLSVARLPDGHPDAGRMLVAADGTFGVLRTDSLGREAYAPLTSHLPEDESDLGIVWKASATSRAGYFLTPDRFFRWQSDSLHTWTTSDISVPDSVDRLGFASPDERQFFFSFVVRDTLYVQVRGVGLLRAEGDGLRLVSADRRLAFDGIYALMPYGDDELLIGTRTEGLFRTDGSAVRALDWAVEPWLQEHQLYHGRRLPDGTYVLGTRQGGVLRMMPNGRRLYVIDESVGLKNDKVHFTFADRSGGLWLALQDGVARIDLDAPYTYYDESLDLPEQAREVERHRGTLFVGTTSGVYRLQTREGDFPRFVKVPGFNKECNTLRSTSRGLMIVMAGRVAVWRNGDVYTVHGDDERVNPWGALQSQHHPEYAYVGYTSGGVRRLRHSGGRWRLDTALAETLPVTDLAEADDGTLWATGTDGGAVRIENPASSSPIVTHYGLDDGLPVLIDLSVFSLNGEVYFGTRQGLHRFDAERNAFVPDSTFGADWADPAIFVTHLQKQSQKVAWGRAANLTRKNDHAVIAPFRRKDGVWQRGEPLRVLRTSVVRGLHVENSGLWVGARDPAPLVRRTNPLQEHTESSDARPFVPEAPLLRRVTVGVRDSLVYGGPDAPPIRLTHTANDLRVAVAQPTFSHTAPVQYRTRRNDHVWSDWSDEATLRYDNLPSGTHRIQVQARIVAGPRTRIATLPLTIAAPWYRTWGALALWGVLGLTGLWGVAVLGGHWRTRRLKARQQELRERVEAQTAELRAEKKRAADALDTVADQKEAIAELNEAQSEFFANVSHEFRTPLTVALGLLEEWVESPEEALPEDVRRDLRQVLLNNRRLLRLVNQILDIARLESDAMDLQVHRVDLGAALKRIGQAFVGLAERRDVTYQRECPAEMVPIAADPEQLETVVVNLLSNAFKYTPEGGRVTLALTFDEEAACIRVSDTGPGIPADEQADIFDRFHQSDTAQTIGTGIGLSLAQALVERHGGTIAVESTVGEGSTFTVRLPRGTAHLEGRPDVTWQESGDSTPGEPSDSLLPPVLASDVDDPPQEAPETESDDRTTVLVVDDNADIRSYVRRHLAPTYRVVEAADGEKGLAQARNLTPDCIVSDVMMPRMDGSEMLRELRSDPATDFLPVIFLTAKAAMDDKLEGLDAGADDYLTKPFRPDELKTRIRNLIAQRMRLRERFRDEGREVSDPSIEEESASPFLKKVKATIREHISDEDLSVSTLAAEVGASRSKLYRKMGDVTDVSPAELIWQVRLDEARRLLREGAGNVSEVAYGVGFKSVSHFTNRFRERFDDPPSAVVASSEAV